MGEGQFQDSQRPFTQNLTRHFLTREGKLISEVRAIPFVKGRAMAECWQMMGE
jgi:hypothetical protein